MHTRPPMFRRAWGAEGPDLDETWVERAVGSGRRGRDDARVQVRLGRQPRLGVGGHLLAGADVLDLVVGRRTQLTVRPGDFVEFVTQDRRVHVLTFDLQSLSPPAAEFLLGSGQQSSPPLVESGTRFVVSFASAPPGA